MQAVADDPASIPARQVMLSQAQSFASRFHLMNDRLESLNDGVNIQIRNSVSTINSLSSSIARLNQDIVNFSGGGTGQPPNDLLDETVTADAVYTDDVLAGIAQSGFNGIWVHGLLHHLVSEDLFPELGLNATIHQEKLGMLIERAAKYAIKVYIYMQCN